MKLIDQFVSSFPPLPPLDQAHLVVGPLLPLDLVAFLPYIHWSTGPSSLGRRSFAVTGPSSFPPLHPLDQAHLVVGHLLSLDQRLGIRCRLTSAIRRVVTSFSDVH